VYVGFDGLGFSVYGRDASTGVLTLLGDAPGAPSGGGLFDPSIAVSPGSTNIYGVDGQDNELLQYDTAGGGVVAQQSYPVLAGTTTAKDPVTVTTSPDGTSVYVLTYGYGPADSPAITSRGAITAFQRNPANGNLSLAGTTIVDCCGGVVDPIVAPDGKFVYIADSGASGGVVVLSRDTTTGALTLLGIDGDLNGALAIAMSPDGSFIYEAGPPSQTSSASSAVSVLARNTATGRLTPVSEIENGAGGVSELSDIWSLAASNDGNCLYATSRADGSLATFARDSATGALYFDGALTEGTDGVTGLADARQVSVSPDGKNLYVASPGDNGVAVFSRDPSTCAPTFLQLAQDLFTIDPPSLDPIQGTATLPVDVQTAGTIALTVAAPAAQSSARIAAAATTPTQVQPGLNRLPITLHPEDQATLDRDHELNVSVAVTFTADGGSPTTKTIDIRLVKTSSAAQIRKALLMVLVPSGKPARIATLLRNRDYRVRFRSPGPGRLTIGWSSEPQRSDAATAKTRPLLVAGATATFSEARTATVKIALTKQGRQLLASSKRLKLSAKATFRLQHGTTVRVAKSFTLTRDDTETRGGLEY